MSWTTMSHYSIVCSIPVGAQSCSFQEFDDTTTPDPSTEEWASSSFATSSQHEVLPIHMHCVAFRQALTLHAPPYPHWLQCIQVTRMRIALTTCRFADMYTCSVCASVHFMFLINPLCRYSWSLLVDPTHVCWEETWATVEKGGDQLSSMEQRYSECCKLISLTSPLHHCCSVCYIILSSTRWWCIVVLHCNQ